MILRIKSIREFRSRIRDHSHRNREYNYLSLPIYERYGIFVNQTHPLAHQSTITADDLGDYPVIYPWRNILQNELSAVVGLDPQKLNIKITANLSLTVYR